MTIRLAPLALVLAAAPAAADVNIYSYRQPELVQPLLDAFTQATGIETNIAFLDKGMVQRLQAEGARSPADVILTSDISRLTEAVEAGVTQPVDSAAINAAIPANLRDPENHWYGLTTRARVVYASRDRVAEGEIATYEDLADPKWKGRICTRSGLHAYNIALTSAMIARDGAEVAQDWLEGLKANLARKPQGNDRAQVKAIWAGECDISLGNTYYMGLMQSDPDQQAWADAVRIVFPVFEGGGTHVNLSGMAMTAAAPHRDEALALMEFLASAEPQQIYGATNFEYPVTPGVAPSDTVANWGSLTPDTTPLADIAARRAEALRLTETVDFDG
ncbi:MAG: extracellular solute-binding protein [Rhodobacteraceae bacterium]|nr:extracellular solute-binding protein [Paracoccaceae bacterium]